MKKPKRRAGRPRRASKYSSVTTAPWNGDHGTGTRAAMLGTEIVEVIDDNGKNPNRQARRQRVNRVEWMLSQGFLSMRQYQAGKAIQEAHGRVESLSSGGELKLRVQSSPKPDATVAVQCEAVSRLTHVMRPIIRADRQIVEHVCWHNRRITELGRNGHVRAATRFRNALDKVADHLRY